MAPQPLTRVNVKPPSPMAPRHGRRFLMLRFHHASLVKLASPNSRRSRGGTNITRILQRIIPPDTQADGTSGRAMTQALPLTRQTRQRREAKATEEAGEGGGETEQRETPKTCRRPKNPAKNKGEKKNKTKQNTQRSRTRTADLRFKHKMSTP